MKPLKVTETHKSKLMEMCKVLFPKYTFYFTWFNSGTQEIKFWNENMKNPEFIHWFEFCTIHLLPKLNFEPNILLNSSLKNKHLVDYLYEQFKN